MKNNGAPRVLVIDDNPGLRLSLTHALESEGYSVRTGADGLEGIAIAREFLPAVIVCDMHMPHSNGSSVLAALRQEEVFASSQFILMTGDRDGTPQRVGMDLGADDYLAKPFTIDEFLKCVAVRLHRSKLHKKAEDRALIRFRESISHSLPHEVFTPLTGILGFTEVLREEIGQVSALEAGKMVGEIQISAERLYRTLKNYLRILDVLNETEPVNVKEERTLAVEISGILLTAAESVTIRNGRSEDFTFDGSPLDLPVSPVDLSTVIIELIDNACKYSLKGTPIQLSLKPAGNQVKLEVVDQGRGMSAEQITQIGAFRQFDRKKYEQQGLGLGLTLTQHLVERYGGAVRIESAPDKGTTVCALWPAVLA